MFSGSSKEKKIREGRGKVTKKTRKESFKKEERKYETKEGCLRTRL